MKSMIRTAFAALLAVLALSAIASASASASACQHIEKETTFCVAVKGGPLEKVTGEVPFKSVSSAGVIGEWRGSTISCYTESETGIFHANSTEGIPVTNRVIEFSSCTLAAYPSCKVAEPLVLGKESGASGLNGEVTLSGGEFKLTSYPATGKVLGTMHLSGSECQLGTTQIIKAEREKEGLNCGLADIKTEAVEHKDLCKGAELNMGGGTPLYLHDMEDHLALTGTYAGKKWSLWEQ